MIANFVKKLEEAMFAAGINESELAKRMGVTRPAVSALKKSKKPRKKTIYRLARALNVRRQIFLPNDFIDLD